VIQEVEIMVSKESMKRAILYLKMAFLMNVLQTHSRLLSLDHLPTFCFLKASWPIFDSNFSSFSFHDHFQLLLKVIHTYVE